ncbi:hypothetical protein [Azospirillum sp.]|uniref:hypothetical protein n=1 Tax=Azospirillum sp. TaxID=34012 RepID=UPI002D2DA8F5|nr:hypothetical protein [Azospirillum sp.]HYD67393.1 hypothetical protein [Azospirillum sp.]
MSDRELFLKANANSEFISAQIAIVIRELVRALAANNDPKPRIAEAAIQMKFVTDLLAYCDEPVSYYNLLSQAVLSLREFANDKILGDVDQATLSAAKVGMSLFAESTSIDNAARGRLSKRQQAFLSEIEQIDLARNRMRDS